MKTESTMTPDPSVGPMTDQLREFLCERTGHRCNDADAAPDEPRQPDAIPAAEAWLAHWKGLLVTSPMSAHGPLASLITDARTFEVRRLRAETDRLTASLVTPGTTEDHHA